MKTSQLLAIFMVSTNIFAMHEGKREKIRSFSDDLEDIVEFEQKDAQRRGIASSPNTTQCPFNIFAHASEQNEASIQPISRRLIGNGFAITNAGLLDVCRESSLNENSLTVLHNTLHGITKTAAGASITALGYTVQAGEIAIKLAYQHPQEACLVGFIAATAITQQYNNCLSCKR